MRLYLEKLNLTAGRRPMKKTCLSVAFVLLLMNTLIYGVIRKTDGKMQFTVSMEKPQNHCYHVRISCQGLAGGIHDFKMPAWTPGFYMIMNHAKNVLNFSAADLAGKPLAWEKIDKNTWRIQNGRKYSILVDYDVYAFGRSVAESYLDDERGFISPTSVFMHSAGRLQQPVAVTVKPYRDWSRIASGLDPVPGTTDTFTAPDFDVLYDSPILVGKQEALTFEVQGIPHVFVAADLENIDREKLIADLRLIVTAATGVFGEIPYRRYAFLAIGPGQGGLEHLNSVAFTFTAGELANPAGYKKWLCFIAHEFFHLYNIKRIRPLALGPFDYERENYTDLLWVSEGFTVYFEDLIMNRAGLLSRDEVLERLRTDIANYEKIPGHLFQSAAASSFDIWCHFLDWGENADNTTISYYDKGSALALLLDLKIRHETGNKKTLDDAMRTLYQNFYKGKSRGFSDSEFRAVCEKTAGCRLDEFFAYTNTVQEIDYKKYLAYGGLDIDILPREIPGAFLGAAVREQEGKFYIQSVEWDSPAANSGLCAHDEIIAVDGERAAAGTMAELRERKKPGEKIRIMVARDQRIREYLVGLGKKTERSFAIKPLANPSPLQAAILKSWLR
jgi:predicted metalloprotease with PDZ domain